jgi:phage terminase large subunit
LQARQSWRQSERSAEVIPVANQWAARRIFPRCWFNEKATEAGRDALGYYHERRDENRNVGLGPEHDWSSHAADSFGYMAIAYDEPPARKSSIDRRQFNDRPRGTFWSA